jgi:L-lactate dehydrogenase complex protein LldF
VIDRLPGLLAGWTRARDLQPLPAQTFREWWRARERESGQRAAAGAADDGARSRGGS